MSVFQILLCFFQLLFFFLFLSPASSISTSPCLDPKRCVPTGIFPLRRVKMITTQNIVSATPTKTSATRKVLAATAPHDSAGRPGRNVKGIRLYQPAPKPESPDNNISITAASITQNDILAHLIPDKGFLPHLLVA